MLFTITGPAGQNTSCLGSIMLLECVCVCACVWVTLSPPNSISLRRPPSQELQPLMEWPHPCQAWLTAWLQRQWVDILSITCRHEEKHTHALIRRAHFFSADTRTHSMSLFKNTHGNTHIHWKKMQLCNVYTRTQTHNKWLQQTRIQWYRHRRRLTHTHTHTHTLSYCSDCVTCICVCICLQSVCPLSPRSLFVL